MREKTIDNLVMVDFQSEYIESKNYDKAFKYTIENLMPISKNIHILYNGLEFNYYDVEAEKEEIFRPQSYINFMKHYRKYGIHGIGSTPRIVVENAITPLTKNIFIYPKTFYYILPWLLEGATNSQILNGLARLVEENLSSIELNGKELFFPEWFFDLNDNIGDEEEVVLVGGFRNKFLKEVELLIHAIGIDYAINAKGVYG